MAAQLQHPQYGKEVNISCSYNPRNGLCYTCFGEPHSAREGNSDGLTLYKSRGWGDLPQQLRRLDEKDETLWIEKLAAALNRELRLSLATGVASGRTLSAVRAQEEVGGRLEYKVAGASNAARTAAALARRGEMAEKVGQLGWSLAIEKDTDGLIEQLGTDSNDHMVLVFHCMDNGSFFSMNKTGVQSP